MSTDVMPDGTLLDRASGGEWGDAWAVFSPDRRHRYALTRTWDESLPTCAFLMLNPSTADAFKVDPTVRRCLGFAQRWGCGSLLVLNVFAVRSTNPEALYGYPDPTGPENDRYITGQLEAHAPAVIVAGWGRHAHGLDAWGYRRPRAGTVSLWRSRAHDVVDLVGDRLQALHVNADGSPKHPLYVAGDAVPEPYRLDPVAKVVYGDTVTEERPPVTDRSLT